MDQSPVQKLLVIRQPDGQLVTQSLPLEQPIMAVPQSGYAIIDPATGKTPANLIAKKRDDDLVIDLEGEQAIVVEAFFSTEGTVFVPQATLADDALTGAALDALAAADGNEDSIVWPQSSEDESSLLTPIGWGVGFVGGLALALGGSSSSDDATNPTGPAPTPDPEPIVTNITGTLVAGPVIEGNGLTVDVFAADGVTLLGTTTVDANGQFIIDVGDYTGAIIARVRDADDGADYLDEATNQPTDLTADLSAIGVVTEAGSRVSLNINPVTTLAAEFALNNSSDGSLTAESVNAANQAIAELFNLGNLHDVTPSATNNGTFDGTDGFSPAEMYGLLLATFSGADQHNAGDSQATIHDILAAISTDDSGNLVLSEQGQSQLLAGADLVTLPSGDTTTHNVAPMIDTYAPTFTSEPVADNLAENSGAAQTVFTAAATDASIISYSIKQSDDDDSALFSINAQTGDLTLTHNPDHEAQASYQLTIIATDSAGNSSEQTLTLNVDDLDESTPNFTSASTAPAIEEDSGAGQVIYTAVATDTADVDDSTDTSAALTYQLKQEGDHAELSIDANTGEVTLIANPDFDTQSRYDFTVIATDVAGNTTEQTVSLDIDEVADVPPPVTPDTTSPVITSAATAPAIDENSGANQVIYTASATDNSAVTYSLTAGSDAALSINASTGAVTLSDNPDFETKASYNFTVVATDAAGNTSEQAVSLSINDIADETAPTVSSVAITSATGIQNSAVNADDVVTATVTMSEATNVDTTDGAPRLALNIGGNTVYANYAGGSGTNALTFIYTVQAGDTDANGISIVANALNANGGTLEDAAGNTAELAHSAVTDNVSYLVDTTAPTAQVILNPLQHMLEPTGVTDGDDQAPQITALGSDGAFAVTWFGEDAGGDNSIFVQRFNSSGAVADSPILLEPDGVTNGNDFFPQITVLGSDGAFAVTWYGQDADGDYSIFVQRFNSAGAPLGSPILLEPDGVTNDHDLDPQITPLGSDGAFAVTWHGFDAGGDYSIFVQRFNSAGAAVGNPVLLEPDGVTNENDYVPQITALGSDGAFAVTWRGDDVGGDLSIFIQRFDSAGAAVGNPVLLEPNGVTNGIDSYNQITPLGSDGAFVVTWRGQDAGGDYSIFVQRFDSAGAPVGNPVLLEPDGVTGGGDYAPQIIPLDSDGAFVVTWYGIDASGDFSIFVQRFNSAGAAVGSPVLLEPDGVTTSTDRDPQITALGSDGAFVVTWHGQDADGDYSIFVQRFDSTGSAVGSPIRLEPEGVTGGGDENPQITALSNDGAFAVTWRGADAGGDDSIFVQQFNADGTPVLQSTIDASGSVTVQSTEVGTAYLVHDSVTVTSVSDITGAADQFWNQAAIATANTDVSVAATGLADGDYQVYTADAAGNVSAAAATGITIDNTAPSFTSGANATAIDENSGAGQVVYDADATDVTDLTYSLKAVDDHADFTIEEATGEVTLTGDPDFEAQNSYNFTVVATDALGNSSEQAVTLGINDIADETAPTVSTVAITSATGIQNNTVNADDVVTATVTMSEATDVDTTDGTPRLALNIGGNSVYATYAGGSGTTALTFTYTVQAGDTDADGISIEADALDANGGTIEDAAGNTAVLTHIAIADNAGYLVDTTAPTAQVVLYPIQHLLEPDDVTNGDDQHPQISSLSSDGAFAVTWSGVDTGNDNSIFVQRFDNSGAVVGSPILLEPNGVTLGNDISPQVTALGTEGAFVVTWRGEDADGDDSIFVQRFDSSGTVAGSPIALEPTGVTDGDDDDPQLTALGTEGAFAVTWNGRDADGEDSIFVQHFDSSGAVAGSPVVLEPTGVTDGGDYYPQLTPLGADGASVVTWSGQDTDRDLSIFVQRFNSSGAMIGTPVLLEPSGVTTASDVYPQVAALGSDGAFALTWSGGDTDGDLSIFVQRFNSSGVAVDTPIKLEPDGVTNGTDQAPQLVALGTDGAFVVTWSGLDTDGEDSIFVQRFDSSGVAVDTPIKLEPDGVTNGTDQAPQLIALGTDGAFAVIWSGVDTNGDNSIFVQRFDSSGAMVDTPILLEPDGVTNGSDDNPQITPLGTEGDFAVTWSGRDADGDHSIFVQRFNADGTPVLESTAMDASGLATIQSAEPGTAYLVHDSITINTQSDITSAADQFWNQAAIATANTDVNVAATGLADGNYQVYTADRAGNLSTAAATNITIDNTPPSFTSGSTAAAIEEHSGSGQTVYTAITTDLTDLTYTLKAVDDHADFTIDETTGEVTLTSDPDFETQSSYDFTVVATDALGNSSEQAVTLGINNTAPTAQVILDPMQYMLEPNGVTNDQDIAPQITPLGSDGAFAVTWYGKDAGNDWSIFVQRFDSDGAPLGSPILLEPDGVTNGHDKDPQITPLGSDGGFAVTWYGWDADGDWSIFVQRFDSDGAPLGSPILLEPDGVTNGPDLYSQITPLGSDGAFAVTWYGYDSGSDYSIFVQRFNSAGEPVDNPILLEPTGVTDGHDYAPQITPLGSDGAFVVTWYGIDASGDFSIFVQRFDSIGLAVDTPILLEPIGVTNGTDYDPQITPLGSDGAFAVTWYGYDVGSGRSIFVQRFNSAGAAVGSPVLLEHDGVTTNTDQDPQITSLGSDGAFVVTWYGYDGGSDSSIFVQRFNSAGEPVDNPILLEPTGVTGGNDDAPQITPLGSDGAFAVTWRGYDGNDLSIFVQRFDSIGLAVGTPILLKPIGVTNGTDYDPQITPLGSEGAFAVTWSGLDANGDRSIFVQRFNADGTLAYPDSTIINASGTVTVQSSDPGTAYVVHESITVNTLSDITGADDQYWNQAAIATANTDVSVAATGLAEGNYQLYTADPAGNLSAAAATPITIDNTPPSFTSGATATAIDENSGSGQTVYTAAATDVTDLTYTLKA
ncbi:cadherin repeat domain-containing protein, partial [Gilvimarinus agarilyticus]|uniref:cadherin domain-containing protein n=1 Tax=Gilvimarinus sp. 2_MG-2023 TaxID=3062666 RepID=UPI001C094B47